MGSELAVKSLAVVHRRGSSRKPHAQEGKHGNEHDNSRKSYKKTKKGPPLRQDRLARAASPGLVPLPLSAAVTAYEHRLPPVQVTTKDGFAWSVTATPQSAARSFVLAAVTRQPSVRTPGRR